MLISENQHHSSKPEDVNNFCNPSLDDERRFAKMTLMLDGYGGLARHPILKVGHLATAKFIGGGYSNEFKYLLGVEEGDPQHLIGVLVYGNKARHLLLPFQLVHHGGQVDCHLVDVV